MGPRAYDSRSHSSTEIGSPRLRLAVDRRATSVQEVNCEGVSSAPAAHWRTGALANYGSFLSPWRCECGSTGRSRQGDNQNVTRVRVDTATCSPVSIAVLSQAQTFMLKLKCSLQSNLCHITRTLPIKVIILQSCAGRWNGPSWKRYTNETVTKLLEFTRQIAIADLSCSHKLPLGSIVTKVYNQVNFRGAYILEGAFLFWKGVFF